jgi:LemA protein
MAEGEASAAVVAEAVVSAASAALEAALVVVAQAEAGRFSNLIRGLPEASRGEKHSMSKGLWIALGVVGVLVLGVLMVFGSYIGARNQMVAKDQAVKSKWSEVDVQLERRADLIPNLVETVKGFTKEESTVFGDIANARAGMLNAQGPSGKIAANGKLDSALGRLLLLTENYPHLRSSDQFMRLQDELAGTENRISVARKRYNDAIQEYNTFILQFPNNIWAGMAGYHENTAYFAAPESAKTAPAVKF